MQSSVGSSTHTVPSAQRVPTKPPQCGALFGSTQKPGQSEAWPQPLAGLSTQMLSPGHAGKPRDPQAPLFAGTTLVLALLQGLVVLLAVVGAYAWCSTWLSEPAARAFTFTTLVMGNLALIFSNRSRSASLWVSLRVPHRVLWMVAAATTALLALTLDQPWVSGLFQFAPLQAHDVLLAAALGLSSVVWFEAIKWSRRSARQRQEAGA